MKITKLFIINIIFFLFSFKFLSASDFENWKIDFKKKALDEGISIKTLNRVIDNTRFLPDVIKYDRYQPEFYEDTYTYISKRTSQKKVAKGRNLYNSNQKLIEIVSNEFLVDKNLLLALMGIETNFGTYLGKMDIVSSLATLSFDKRRSKFFTSELITLLKLVDANIIDPDTLFGSWAGAFGNFQFMPSTITNHAIDYNNDKKIDLKNIEDSFASAANYIKNLGWKNDIPCFYKINLKDDIPLEFLNTSAKKLNNKRKVKYFSKYIENSDYLKQFNNLNSAIITPDVDIVENAKKFSPAYIVFDNYDLILKWNRSLRFALAVCTLRDKFKDEL
ncbi:lytic murein transglycosylase [Candidatus Pelagibacter sp. RS40]|uniref:lytic murein transglycosylase n=1 Tax=Candidatus Pelagibacter sp. RS40 TaxID=1977865 RepID=UPI000A14EB82|nr:lytic murein transglycosylase [Candidatus Pelagibacter sp. RS40]ARJ49745.1 lytic transglycosylase [Candidatus Pelagibacter sp. RS40]